jgi:hypothetical protein
MVEGVDDAVEAAWRKVVVAWDDDDAHRRFLALCDASDRLGEAGRRYRAVKESEPARAERAEAQIDAVLGLAMRNLSALKTEPSKKGTQPVMFLLAFAVSAGLIVSALWMVLGRF